MKTFTEALSSSQTPKSKWYSLKHWKEAFQFRYVCLWNRCLQQKPPVGLLEHDQTKYCLPKNQVPLLILSNASLGTGCRIRIMCWIPKKIQSYKVLRKRAGCITSVFQKWLSHGVCSRRGKKDSCNNGEGWHMVTSARQQVISSAVAIEVSAIMDIASATVSELWLQHTGTCFQRVACNGCSPCRHHIFPQADGKWRRAEALLLFFILSEDNLASPREKFLTWYNLGMGWKGY